MEYLKNDGNICIRHFDLLDRAWHQSQISIETLMQFSCAVLWTKDATCYVLVMCSMTTLLASHKSCDRWLDRDMI